MKILNTGIAGRISKLEAKHAGEQESLSMRRKELTHGSGLEDTRLKLKELSDQQGFAGSFNRGKLSKVSSGLKAPLAKVSFNDLLGSMSAVFDIAKTPFGKSILGDIKKDSESVSVELEQQKKAAEATLDTSRLDDLQTKINSQKARQKTILRIKGSPAYRALVEAKAQKVKLNDGDHVVSQSVEDLDLAVRGLDKQISGLNELSLEEVDEDTMTLLDTLSLLRETAKESLAEKEDALYSEAEKIDKDISGRQKLIENQIRQQL